MLQSRYTYHIFSYLVTKGFKSKESSFTIDGTPFENITPQKIIKNFSKVLDTITGDTGTGAIDEAVGIAYGRYFKSNQDVIDKLINERKKYAEDVIPENGSLDTSFIGNSYSVGRKKFTLAKWINFNKGQYNTISYKDLDSDDKRYLFQSGKTWRTQGGLKIINDSFGYSYEDDNSTNDKTLLMFINDPNDSSTWDSGLRTDWHEATSYLSVFGLRSTKLP